MASSTKKGHQYVGSLSDSLLLQLHNSELHTILTSFEVMRHIFVTDPVRSTRREVVFSLSTPGGGGQVQWGGPQPGLTGGTLTRSDRGYPSQGWGTPLRPGQDGGMGTTARGYPLARSGWGVPQPVQDEGYPMGRIYRICKIFLEKMIFELIISRVRDRTASTLPQRHR